MPFIRRWGQTFPGSNALEAERVVGADGRAFGVLALQKFQVVEHDSNPVRSPA